MRKYYYKDSAGQQHGPLKLDKLKDKGLIASTPVWYDGLEKWTTADQVDELKTLVNPPVIPVAEPVKPVVEPEQSMAEAKAAEPVIIPAPAPAPIPVATSTPVPEPVITTAASTSTIKTPSAAVKTVPASNKSTAWLSYVLGILILGGVGYFIYQDMEKNDPGSTEIVLSDVQTNTANNENKDVTPANTEVTPVSTTTPGDTTVVTTTTTEPTALTTNTSTAPGAEKKAADEKKKQQAALAKKKAEDDKKKQLAADAKKEEERKKQLAAQAARETEMRNNWSRYITLGQINFEKDDDGIKAFPVTVYNGLPVPLDKVTVRVDYLKKEGKVVSTETYLLTGISAKGSQNILAKNNKKAKRANVYIISATSRQLHFCYPVNSGNASDPYFCN